MERKDGGEGRYQHAGREMRRNSFPAIHGLVRIIGGGFEDQDKNQTEILMFTHKADRRSFALLGIDHGILVANFYLDIRRKDL